MTATDLAAALIAGVPHDYNENGQRVLPETEVLAALTAALDGVDERAGEVLEGVKAAEAFCRSEECFLQADHFGKSADLITALFAQNAALRAERDAADDALVDRYRDPKTGVFKFPTDVAAIVRRLDAAEAKVEKLRGERDALQRTYDDLYSDALADAKSDAQDFESDLWEMVRAYLDELHFDWRDFMEDGVTANEAVSHIRECMNEETRRAEAAEAKVEKLRREVEQFRNTNRRLNRRVQLLEGWWQRRVERAKLWSGVYLRNMRIKGGQDAKAIEEAAYQRGYEDGFEERFRMPKKWARPRRAALTTEADNG